MLTAMRRASSFGQEISRPGLLAALFHGDVLMTSRFYAPRRDATRGSIPYPKEKPNTTASTRAISLAITKLCHSGSGRYPDAGGCHAPGARDSVGVGGTMGCCLAQTEACTVPGFHRDYGLTLREAGESGGEASKFSLAKFAAMHPWSASWPRLQNRNSPCPVASRTMPLPQP